jgi:transcriptional regulator with XRE-family HTH domain
MKEKIREIAQRIRELRELEGISPEQMAAGVGVEPEYYQACEAGQVDIPASMLLEIAQILKTDITVLLTGDSPFEYFYVTRKGRGVDVERRQATLQSSGQQFYSPQSRAFSGHR